MPQFAYLESDDDERRAGPRKRLRLSSQDLGSPGDEAQLVVHEISETGLLLESSLPLAEGEELEVITPGQRARRVTIIWASGRYFACRFAAVDTRADAPGGMDEVPEKGSPKAVSLAGYQLHELSMAIERITSVLDRAMNELSKRDR